MNWDYENGMPLWIRTRKTMSKFYNGHGNVSKMRDLLKPLQSIYYVYENCKLSSFFRSFKKIIYFLLVLNKRLDARVDDMITNGLLREIEDFKKEFESKFKGWLF